VATKSGGFLPKVHLFLLELQSSEIMTMKVRRRAHFRVFWVVLPTGLISRKGSVNINQFTQFTIGDHCWSSPWFSNKQHYLSESIHPPLVYRNKRFKNVTKRMARSTPNETNRIERKRSSRTFVNISYFLCLPRTSMCSLRCLKFVYAANWVWLGKAYSAAKICLCRKLSVTWKGIFCGSCCLAFVGRRGSGRLDGSDQWVLDSLIVLTKKTRHRHDVWTLDSWIMLSDQIEMRRRQDFFVWRLRSILFGCCSMQFIIDTS